MKENDEIIAKIDKLSEKIHKIWSDINIYDIENLKASWNDTICDEFIKKIKNTAINSINNHILSFLLTYIIRLNRHKRY